MLDNENKKQPTERKVETKYVHQHLASDRTFLAWIGTAIAIFGVGFL
jgi:putative membrane protein